MPQPDEASHRRPVWLLAGLAALTVLLGALIPLAPVHAEQPVVTWPAAGQAPESTTLALAAYRPLELDATVACSTLRALDARGGDALRTVPADVGESAAEGLTVTVSGGRVDIASSGTMLATEPLPDGDCAYRVTADHTGMRVARDGEPLGNAPGLLSPQVAELATDATGPAAAGLSVRLLPDDRYASSPSALKVVLLIGHALALAATMLLAWRVWRGRDVPGLARPRPSAADAVVVVGSAVWAVIGGMNWDDSWYLLMARNAGLTGFTGNYVYMFNAIENPFVLSQYLMQGWGSIGGWSLLWMRMLPLVYGLLTWLLLRVLIATMLGRAARLRWVPWMLLVAHLLWWLPYGLQLRPEPLIALCAAGVLVAVELARRRRSLGALAVAVLVCALALTVSPSGMVAAAPFLMAAPWVFALLREWSWARRGAAVLVAAAAATVAVPIGFADASLGEVADATATHTWYYISLAWYDEIQHYQGLLIPADTGVWGRRAPVVLTIAVLVLVAIGSGRRVANGDPVRRMVLIGAINMVVAMGLLAFTPTKWVNHFGALSATGTVLLAGALLRSPLPRRAGQVVTIGAVAVLVWATALVFAGPNLWRPYSDWGMPFGDHFAANGSTADVEGMAPHIGPVFLRNPVLWAVVAVAVAVAITWWRRRGRQTSLTTDRGLLVTVSVLAVALMFAVFVFAPIRQYPGWTVAQSNLNTLRGETCGLATDVQVLTATGEQPVPTGAPELIDDFALAAGAEVPVRPPSADAAVWHDQVPADRASAARERGIVRTPWFELPASEATDLAVPVIGQDLGQQEITLELDTGDRAEPDTIALQLDDRTTANTWQEVAVALDEAPGGRPIAVRVVAEDVATAAGSWLGVAAPSLAVWRPVTELVDDNTVFADQLAAALWPCLRQTPIRNGIVEQSQYLIRSDDGIPEFILVNPVDPLWAGAHLQAEFTATYVQRASRLDPAGPPTRPWGRVLQVLPDHPPGRYDLRVEERTESGLHRDRPVSGEAFSGRGNIG